jgi:hypothetical protein
MQRRRFKQVQSLEDRLAEEAARLREQAQRLPYGAAGREEPHRAMPSLEDQFFELEELREQVRQAELRNESEKDRRRRRGPARLTGRIHCRPCAAEPRQTALFAGLASPRPPRI